MAAEGRFKRGGIEWRGTRRGWGDGLRHRAQNIFVDAGAGRKGIAQSMAYLPPVIFVLPIVNKIFATADTEDHGKKCDSPPLVASAAKQLAEKLDLRCSAP